MLDDDREMREAMSVIMSTPAPPGSVDLDVVIRQGQRRLYTRRALVAVGTFSFVAATLMVTTLLPAEPPPGAINVVVGAIPTTALQQTDPRWAPAPVQRRSPTSTWSPGPTAGPPTGWTVLKTPLCPSDLPTGSEDTVGTVDVEDSVVAKFVQAVKQSAPGAEVSEIRSVAFDAGKPGSTRTFHHWLDIGDADGIGSVEISAGRFHGTPTNRADAEVFHFRNCAPPDRITLEDGTVAQLYSPMPSEPFQSLLQVLRIYRTDGTVYQLRLQNFGSRDFRLQDDGRAFERTGPGRETLPLQSAQLASIGLALA